MKLSLDEINERMCVLLKQRELLISKTREYYANLFSHYGDDTQDDIIKGAIETCNSVKEINNEISILTLAQTELMNKEIDDIISNLEAYR